MVEISGSNHEKYDKKCENHGNFWTPKPIMPPGREMGPLVQKGLGIKTINEKGKISPRRAPIWFCVVLCALGGKMTGKSGTPEGCEVPPPLEWVLTSSKKSPKNRMTTTSPEGILSIMWWFLGGSPLFVRQMGERKLGGGGRAKSHHPTIACG